jgi:hypothetical protein
MHCKIALKNHQKTIRSSNNLKLGYTYNYDFCRRKFMQTQILVIKAKFEMIKIVLSGSLSVEDLSHKKYLKVLIDASENTYLQLTEGICQSLVMCKECANKRDILNRYINLLDDIELGKSITPEMEEELSRYPEVINEIIDRINTVLSDI